MDAYSRRHFITVAASVLAATNYPVSGRAATPQLLRRAVPGTDESVGVIGLGNTRAFGDPEVGPRLLGILTEHGGDLVDARGDSRFQVVRRAPNPTDVFLSAYVDGLAVDDDRNVLKTLMAERGGQPVDLINISSIEAIEKRWSNLRRLKDEGLARYIGIASFRPGARPAMLKLIPTNTVDFVQTNYSLFERDAEADLLPVALEYQVGVVINRPFMNGDYFPRVKDKPLPDWVAGFDCVSWAQFSLKFIVSHPAVTCVLTETTKPKHALDNMGGGVGRLPDAATRERMAQVLT